MRKLVRTAVCFALAALLFAGSNAEAQTRTGRYGSEDSYPGAIYRGGITGKQMPKRQTLYEGLGMKLVSEIGSGEKEGKSRECALFVEQDDSDIYLGVYGRDALSVFNGNPGERFAYREENHVWVDRNTVYDLEGEEGQESLEAASPKGAATVIEALFQERPVRVRYHEWPSYTRLDVWVVARDLEYAYRIAQRECGWEPLRESRGKTDKAERGAHAKMQKATVNVDRLPSRGGKERRRAKILENDDLSVLKVGTDRCHFQIDGTLAFGRTRGEWTSALTGGDQDSEVALTVRGPEGRVLSSSRVPLYKNENESKGTAWTGSERAVRAALDAGAGGTVSITAEENIYSSASLRGFETLWNWGEYACGFPEQRRVGQLK